MGQLTHWNKLIIDIFQSWFAHDKSMGIASYIVRSDMSVHALSSLQCCEYAGTPDNAINPTLL